MSDDVVVFGASGFIGTRLVARLVESGRKVVAVDIIEPRVRLDGVDYVAADVRNPLSPNIARPGSVLYNLAAVHRTPGHPPHEYYDTNVHGAVNVTRLAEEIGAETIVFTSSISVYGPSEEVIEENSPLRPNSDYGRSKIMGEVIHRQWARGGDSRRLVVVRPGVVFGPGERGNFTNLARALRRGLFAYPGRKTTIKSGGYVDELLAALDFALTNSDKEITFNYAYPDESTTEDIVHLFGQVMNSRKSYPVLPIFPLLAIAWSFEVLAKFGVKTPIHRERIWKLVKSTRIRPAWLLANGYVFETRMETALNAWSAETRGAFT
jgi:nucleoside-diphosphate-sugar epimerase